MLNDGTPNLHDPPTARLNRARDRAAPYRDVLDDLGPDRPDTRDQPSRDQADRLKKRYEARFHAHHTVHCPLIIALIAHVRTHSTPACALLCPTPSIHRS